MFTSIATLVSVSKLLKAVLEEDHFENNIRAVVEKSITNVSTAVVDYNVELHKFSEIRADNFRNKIVEHGHRLQYPFQECQCFSYY